VNYGSKATTFSSKKTYFFKRSITIQHLFMPLSEPLFARVVFCRASPSNRSVPVLKKTAIFAKQNSGEFLGTGLVPAIRTRRQSACLFEMKVHVNYYGLLTDAASCSSEVVTLKNGSTLQNLQEQLRAKYSEFAPITLAFFVANKRCPANVPLKEGQVIDCMPPFAGG